LFFLLIVALVLVFANIIADGYFARWDLTKNKLFSVSEATKRIFSRLEDPVEVTFYLSKKLPGQLKDFKRDTIDKFKELGISSNGNFTWEVVEADKDKATLSKVKRYGIPEMRGTTLGRDEMHTQDFYSGIVLNYMDKQEVIAEYNDVQRLEYEIARKLLQLTMDDKPLIKFFTSIEEEEAPPGAYPGYKNFYDQYAAIMDTKDVVEKFRVARTKLTEDDTIDSRTDCLVIAQPDKLNKRQKYEINKYLSEGGSAIMFVSKRTVKKGRRFTFADLDPQIDDLFKFWGLVIEDAMVADMSAGTLVRTQFKRGAVSTEYGLTPLIVKAGGRGLNMQSPITRNLGSMNFPWVAPIKVDEDKLKENGLEALPLAQSSIKSWVLDDPSKAVSEIRPPASEADFDGPQTLAVLITGKFPFYYADRPIPEWPKEENEEGETEVDNSSTALDTATGAEPEIGKIDQPKEGKLLVVSSVDVIKYDYWGNIRYDRSYEGNVYFFINSLELFSLGPDLIDIRMKAETGQRLEETTSSQKLLLRIFNIGLVPVLIILAGVVRFIWRRREKKTYLKSLQIDREEKKEESSEQNNVSDKEE